MYAGSYGLSSADGQAQPTGSQARGVTWPVRSGLVPPLAEGFIARPDTVPGLEAGDTVPGLEAALVPGAAVALVGLVCHRGRGLPVSRQRHQPAYQ